MEGLARLVVGFLLVGLAVSASKPPHIVYILLDDLGYNDMGYQSTDLPTPTMTSLAKDGIRVQEYYTMPLCTPTRGAFMTGRWPIRLGLQHMVLSTNTIHGLPKNETTLPQKLKKMGYSAYMVGKWHLGFYDFDSTPTHRGFDDYYGYYNGMTDYYTHKIAGFLDLHDNITLDKKENDVYSTPLFERKAEIMVKDHKRRLPNDPLFLYYAMQNVHSPVEAPQAKYPLCDKIPNAQRKTYCQMLGAADAAVGSLMKVLNQTFPGEDVVVFGSGDNGGLPMAGGNNWPLRGHKAELFEGGIRNNLFIWSNSETLIPSARRGQTYDGGLVHVVDMHATVASLGGVQGNGGGFPMDGMNMWNTIIQNKPSPRTEFLVNIDPSVANAQGTTLPETTAAAYRMGQWKLMLNVRNDTWYPVPTSFKNPIAYQNHPLRDISSESFYMGGATPACTSALEKYCGTLEHKGKDCMECCTTNRRALHQAGCDPRDEGQFCKPSQGTVNLLFDVKADPNEQQNVWSDHPDVITQIKAKIEALNAQAMPACNARGGSCPPQAKAEEVAAVEGGWFPWVKDN